MRDKPIESTLTSVNRSINCDNRPFVEIYCMAEDQFSVPVYWYALFIFDNHTCIVKTETDSNRVRMWNIVRRHKLRYHIEH